MRDGDKVAHSPIEGEETLTSWGFACRNDILLMSFNIELMIG